MVTVTALLGRDNRHNCPDFLNIMTAFFETENPRNAHRLR